MGYTQTMWEFLATVGGILFVILVPAVLILILRDKIRGVTSTLSDGERQRRRAEWRERMMQPEFGKVEEFCGGKLPQMLLSMYSDHELIFCQNFAICAPGKDPKREAWWIGEFQPLTVHSQSLTCDLSEFGKGFCFAGDGMGNFYWVPVDHEQRKNAPVYFARHDPWGNQKVAESLEEFLSWPRIREEEPLQS